MRLTGLGDAARDSKAIIDNHASSMDIVTTDAKRKWEEFSKQAEQDSKDGSNFSAAKHCRMEVVLQQWSVLLSLFLSYSHKSILFCSLHSLCLSVNTVDAASQQWKKTHASVNDMGSKHVAEMEALVR